jgi:hypothetical protein
VDNPNGLGSSALKETSSSDCLVYIPFYSNVFIISNVINTPSAPSYLPPLGTVSICEPTEITGKDLSFPNSFAHILAAESTLISRFNFSSWAFNQSRATIQIL